MYQAEYQSVVLPRIDWARILCKRVKSQSIQDHYETLILRDSDNQSLPISGISVRIAIFRPKQLQKLGKAGKTPCRTVQGETIRS